ncbi:MAG: HNH endonuclease [Deltaproteobacteria bacterium]|nr:HNH endonuclease [Deltaproteobacteria bacterium]
MKGNEDIKINRSTLWLVLGIGIYWLVIVYLHGLEYAMGFGKAILIMAIIYLVIYLAQNNTKKKEEYSDNWDEIRRRILDRDSYSCSNCGVKNTTLHVHHVVPLSCGGKTIDSNLVTLCKDCHKSIHPHMR